MLKAVVWLLNSIAEANTASPSTEASAASLACALPTPEAMLAPMLPSASVRASPVTEALLSPSPKEPLADRKSTRLNSSHVKISYAVFCLKKKKKEQQTHG